MKKEGPARSHAGERSVVSSLRMDPQIGKCGGTLLTWASGFNGNMAVKV